MGGIGTGKYERSTAPKIPADPLPALDVGAWSRAGVVGPWKRSSGTWPVGDGSIGYTVETQAAGGRVTLDFRAEHDDGRVENVRQVIGLTTSRPGYLGGLRWAWSCPGCHSNRRKLRLLDGRFGCKKCLGLTWLSVRENHKDERLRRALAKLRRTQATRKRLRPAELDLLVECLDKPYAAEWGGWADLIAPTPGQGTSWAEPPFEPDQGWGEDVGRVVFGEGRHSNNGPPYTQSNSETRK